MIGSLVLHKILWRKIAQLYYEAAIQKVGFPVMQVLFLVGKIPWRRDRLLTPLFLGLPGGSDGKDSTFNVGDLDSIPGLGSPGRGHNNLSSILAWRIPKD